ncbi:MAG: TonB-dependent receptor [Marinoscillum sp.]
MSKSLQLSIGLCLAFVFLASSAFAQTKVSGKVTGSDTNDGLPGVTIQVKGKNIGVISDIDGQYSITAEDDDLLVFSFIGYKSQEVPVNGRTQLDLVLDLDLQQLDEVVVVGYGEQKKATLTGAITTIKPEDLEELPTGNLAQTLIGKLAGVQVNRNGTGIPGTPSPLVIRAESASGTERQVLYVIDGVIYSDDSYALPGPSGSEVFNRLDPSEIESISILKDGAAAVYGARGAGGVVLVKTKRGNPGKLKFTYNGSVGVGQPTQIPEMLSGEQHAQMWNDILDIRKSLGARPSANDYFDDEEMANIRANDYDWLEGLFKAAVNQKHAISVSGGSEDVRYFLSGNYYNETGNYDNLWFKRFSVRTNLEYDITKDLMVGVGINFSEGNRRNPNYDPGSGNTGEGVLRDWYKRPLTAPRWIPPTYNGLPVNNGSWNPYGLLQSDNYKTNTSNNTNLSARLEYNVPFLSGLKLSSLLSYNINSSDGTTFGQDYLTYNFYSEGGNFISEDPSTILINNSEGLRESFEKSRVYQFNVSARYAKSFGNHNVGATFVYEQSDGYSRGFNAQKSIADIRGFDSFWAFQNGTNQINGVYNGLGRWGVIGRLTYDYEGRYIFESAFRSESSSKFSPEERFGVFPSVSAGWVISEESFFDNLRSGIDFLKLRTSVGLVGNDNVRPFEWKPAFNAGSTGPIFGQGTGVLTNAITARQNGFIVPSRTWSKTRTWNYGLDARALSNRLSFTYEHYYALTYDAFDRPLAIYVLGNEKPPTINNKESFSTGDEFQVGFNDKIGGNFNYSIDANFTRRRSRPLKLFQNPLVLGQWDDQTLNDDSNQPGLIALGIIRTDEDLARVQEMYSTINGIPVAKGMIYYEDVGGANYSGPDGQINGDDRRIIAEYTTPPYSYGFGLGFGYKNWRLNASFSGVFGHKEFIQKDEQLVDRNAGLAVNQYTSTFSWWGDYWTEENPNASMPRPAAYGFEGEVSTFWMRDGHTLRMNDISISYTLPKNVMSKIKLANLKFYASATNVWTIISPFDFKDPAVSQAFDYPLVRMINTGLSFSL